MKLRKIILLASISLASFSSTFLKADEEASKSHFIIDGNHIKLSNLVNDLWDYTLKASPEMATYYGYKDYDGRLSDYSKESMQEHSAQMHTFLDRLATIDRAALCGQDQVEYDLLKWELENYIALDVYPNQYFLINQLHGIHQDLPALLSLMPSETDEDFKNIISRLTHVQRVIDQQIELLKEGLSKEITPPKDTLVSLPTQVLNLIQANPADSVFMQPLQKASEELREEALLVVTEQVYPSFAKFAAFLDKEYIPNCRSSFGMCDLPNGLPWYAAVAKTHITVDLTPEEIHQIGLNEVSRIGQQVDQLIEQLGFGTDRQAFQTHVLTDPQFFYTHPQELVEGHKAILSDVEAKLSSYFITLPKTPLEVIPVPEEFEKEQVAAFYRPGSVESKRPGYFYANTYALNTRAKWEMPALALHEGVPGHHLQVMVSFEQEEQSPFRKFAGYTSFIEGWALYAEFLGMEMGMYEDPYSLFGRYSMEMLRAVRLVVDTGMHAKGWTREQAREFFRQHAWMIAEHEMCVEVDRYLVMPGQALGYKIGELKIQEWRANATEQLGVKFDIREFHEQLLQNGSLPLEAIEARIQEWINTVK